MQTKVDALDLFSTVWGIIESPGPTFKRIVLARHKNYIFVLTPLLGISLVYTVFWYKGLGEGGPFSTLGTGLFLGIPVGVGFVALVSLLLTRMARVAGSKPTFRNTYGVVAYSAVPVILGLLFVFPVEMAAFGEDWFLKVPHPRLLNPLVYDVLVALDAITHVWTLVLLVEGIAVVASLTKWKALLLVIVLLSLGGCGLWGLGCL
ncbi:MAG: Yip1 family protein [Bacteroidota bacterium]